jgi:hypothetical protein
MADPGLGIPVPTRKELCPHCLSHETSDHTHPQRRAAKSPLCLPYTACTQVKSFVSKEFLYFKPYMATLMSFPLKRKRDKT